jgi:indole-3-glycerol phosphate synthase
MNILRQICERTKERIRARKETVPFGQVAEAARERKAAATRHRGFRAALTERDISFICEVKKASPSKGVIAVDFPYLDIAKDYESAGAAAISVLTEPFWFLGSDAYLREIADTVRIPVLRKDFVVDEYMIYEARVMGAAAVLLITAVLEEGVLREYIDIARSLGLDVLTEVHDERETETALRAGADIIGVNNRDLRTFEVDITLSGRLRGLVPNDILFVSESGINTPEDVAMLRGIGADAVLIGEKIMRSDDKQAEIRRLRG